MPSNAPHHICFISQEYPPETGWGGIGSYTFDMAHGFARAGSRVTVISRATKTESVREGGGVTVHRVLPAPRFNSMKFLWRLSRYWPGFAWAAAQRFLKIHEIDRVDVVESAEAYADGFFVGLLRPRPPMIVRLHMALMFGHRLNGIVPDHKERFKYWLEKRSILGADIVTAPCQAVADLTQNWTQLEASRIKVVPNPVDTRFFVPDGQRPRQEIIMSARLEKRKLGRLPEALPIILQRCPQAVFRFVGSDGIDESGRSWRERLSQCVPPDQRSRIVFEEAPREEMAQKYRQAAVAVMASRWENFPYALLEAMACGTPVVATRAGGLPEMVDDGVNGILVAPEDGGALADSVCTLLENQELQVRMGRNARRLVEERFSVDAVTPKMIEAYSGAIR